jgi:Tfp pilus assembly protein FimT
MNTYVPNSTFRKRKSLQAFTLIEVLTSLSIVLALSFAGAPALSGLLASGNFNSALDQVSGAMESAQEYAIAHNTYTYVGFTNPNAQGQVFVAVFGASDGSAGGISNVASATTSISSAAPTANTGSSVLVMLSRITTVQGVAFSNSLPGDSPIPGGASFADPATAATVPSTAQLSYATNVYQDGSGGGQITFRRVVQFTPEGEGRVGAYVPTAVQLVLAPTAGNSGRILNAEASVIQIAGITGQVTTFRP